jgi:hypothetical protein
MASFLQDPKHWRDQAEKARARAGDFLSREHKERLLRVAEDYDRLAERAERLQTARIRTSAP